MFTNQKNWGAVTNPNPKDRVIHIGSDDITNLTVA
jgi:hypothetical protein